MTTAIEKYSALKEQKRWADEWIALYGAPYSGGGGGIGKVSSLEAKATIYHQAYNGATNYHDIPKEFIPYFVSAAKLFFPQIIKAAQFAQDEELKEWAAKALAEHGRLIAAAGLEASIEP